MPLGLVSLAANLISENIPVCIYGPKFRIINKPDYINVARDILKHKPTIIGFSTWCISYPTSLLIAKELKKLAPKIPIVFGGPQASILSKETLHDFSYVDFVLAGEADQSFPEFINELKKQVPDFSKISGLAFRNGTEILYNKKNGIVKDLNELPIPAYDLIPIKNTLKLDVGRGCPFHCTYCSTNIFFSKKYRVKSPDRIIQEMLAAYNNRKIKSFSFAHDMFTLNKEFILELCDKLVLLKEKYRLTFTWTCSARIDCVSNKMLIKMKKGGCKSIFFGIESGSEKIQKSIKKNLDLKKAFEIADLCRKIGMEMHVSFIIGFPEETKNDIENTLRCLAGLALKGALVQISDLSLLPGTPLYNSHHNKLKFDGSFSNFSQTICTKEDLKLIMDYPNIFSSFYYLPVKTLSRIEMVFICRLINRASQFRNTLFLLSNYFEISLKGYKLIKLFKTEFKQFISQNSVHLTVTSFWIEIFGKYLTKNRQSINNPKVFDVFNYESFVALLLALFTNRNILYPNRKKVIMNDNFLIKPTPVWKIFTSNYKLEKIIPSENNWVKDSYRLRKGKYTYLLVAISEVNCKRIKITEKEKYFLENLSELFFYDYVKKVDTVSSEKETLLWLKKMRRLGVVEIFTV